MKRGRPKLDVPMRAVKIWAHRADAIAWERMLSQRTVRLTSGELFRMILHRAVKSARKD